MDICMRKPRNIFSGKLSQWPGHRRTPPPWYSIALRLISAATYRSRFLYLSAYQPVLTDMTLVLPWLSGRRPAPIHTFLGTPIVPSSSRVAILQHTG